jgi:hypothetical protein
VIRRSLGMGDRDECLYTISTVADVADGHPRWKRGCHCPQFFREGNCMFDGIDYHC